VAELIDRVITHAHRADVEEVCAKVRQEVKELTAKFPLYDIAAV
jgi:glycine/serine hydroxymethyltransferase